MPRHGHAWALGVRVGGGQRTAPTACKADKSECPIFPLTLEAGTGAEPSASTSGHPHGSRQARVCLAHIFYLRADEL